MPYTNECIIAVDQLLSYMEGTVRYIGTSVDYYHDIDEAKHYLAILKIKSGQLENVLDMCERTKT